MIHHEATQVPSGERVTYEHRTAEDLQALLRLPSVVLFDEVGSTARAVMVPIGFGSATTVSSA